MASNLFAHADVKEAMTLLGRLQAAGMDAPAGLDEALASASWSVNVPPVPDMTKISEAKTEKDYSVAVVAYAAAVADRDRVLAVVDEASGQRASIIRAAVNAAKPEIIESSIERFNETAEEFTGAAKDLPSLSLASMTSDQAEKFIIARQIADRLRLIHSVYQEAGGASSGDTYWIAMAEFDSMGDFRAAYRLHEQDTPTSVLDPYYSVVAVGGRLRLITRAAAVTELAELRQADDAPAEPTQHPKMVGLDPRTVRGLQAG